MARICFRSRPILVGGYALGWWPVPLCWRMTRLWAIVNMLWGQPLLLLLLLRLLRRRQLGCWMWVRGIGVATRMLIDSILWWHSRRRHPVSTIECGNLPVGNVLRQCWRLVVGKRNAMSRMHGRRTPRVVRLRLLQWSVLGMWRHARVQWRRCLVLLGSGGVMYGRRWVTASCRWWHSRKVLLRLL